MATIEMIQGFEVPQLVYGIACFLIGLLSSQIWSWFFIGDDKKLKSGVDCGKSVVHEVAKERRTIFTQAAFDNDEPYAALVGVGPGDANLLTIAALKVLSEADLVLSDRLVSGEILELLKAINPNCEIRLSTKCKGRANIAQDQLNDWLLDAMRRGKKVCRLKGGDPFLFGRGMEEVDHLLRGGFKIKVVPGVSSSFAAPLAAGLSLTKRIAANKVMIATAHGQFDTFPDMPEFRSDCTLVFLMGVSRLPSLMNELNSKGFDNNTPVCVVEKATTVNQRRITGTIQTIADICQEKNIRPPATIIVGNICRNDELPETYITSYRYGGVIFSPK